MEVIDSNKRLALFLRGLSDQLDDGTIHPKQALRIGEFFMAYQFHQQALADNEDDDDECINIDPTDLVRFITLGYHVYTNLLRGRPISSISSDSDE